MVKNILDGRLPKVIWNVECNIQKTNKREILDAPYILPLLKEIPYNAQIRHERATAEPTG